MLRGDWATHNNALVDQLAAISDENRFRLLTELREPKTINDIELTAKTGTAEYRGDRHLTRQGIQYHLDILRDSGFVRVDLENREGRRMNVHQIDPGGLFLFHDGVQRVMASLGEKHPPTDRPTMELDDDQQDPWPPEPRLVLLRGLSPGKAFSLSGKPPGATRGWIVGRSPKAEVSLSYDPYVATEDAEIFPTGEGFRILDLRSSKNRVRVNDQTLPCGGEATLNRGDVVHVGRSSLVYHGP